jgi:hypothetical protein
MRAYRCKCGEMQWFGSDGPPACLTCEVCGTACGGREPAPHEWVTRYNPNTGAPYEICRWCLTKRPEAKKEGT